MATETLTAEELYTRTILRIEEAWRAVLGDSDMKVGQRLGLLHAREILENVKREAEGA